MSIENLDYSWAINIIYDFIDFPIFSTHFWEIAEILRRAHWPRTTCPGLIKQSKLHRFRRGKSSQECPVTARITKNHIFYILNDFSQISPEIVEFSDSLVNSTRIRYFGGPVLDLEGLGSGSTNNQLIWEAAAPNQWIFNGSGRPPKGGPCHASNSQARVTLLTPRPVSHMNIQFIWEAGYSIQYSQYDMMSAHQE